ncbi:MAG: GNAT family N-acetyltransferase [Candidatus Latescibacteria bacterium]|nr:GNAT family N-acetyltransferase [Candidatus Latescibacterota bacterium]
MEIETERLHLREFTTDDIDPITAYRSDPRYLEHYPWSTWSQPRSEAFVDGCMTAGAEDPRREYDLGVALRGIGRLIGSCGLRLLDDGAKRADIGFELSPDYWGNGYATESVSAILELGFDRIGLEEVEARCVVANRRSANVLHRLDFSEAERLPVGPGLGGFTWPERILFRLSRASWREARTSPPCHGD